MHLLLLSLVLDLIRQGEKGEATAIHTIPDDAMR